MFMSKQYILAYYPIFVDLNPTDIAMLIAVRRYNAMTQLISILGDKLERKPVNNAFITE
jgi:hypothetical protein